MHAFSIPRFAFHLVPGCATLMLANACLSASIIEIDLRPAVQVSRAQVVLGDVAHLHTDAAALSLWRDMPLGAVPRSGTATLTRARIARWIKRRTGSSQTTLRWRGAQQVEISAMNQKVAGAQVAATAERVLREWLGKRSERSVITEITAARDVSVAPGNLHR